MLKWPLTVTFQAWALETFPCLFGLRFFGLFLCVIPNFILLSETASGVESFYFIYKIRAGCDTKKKKRRKRKTDFLHLFRHAFFRLHPHLLIIDTLTEFHFGKGKLALGVEFWKVCCLFLPPSFCLLCNFYSFASLLPFDPSERLTAICV